MSLLEKNRIKILETVRGKRRKYTSALINENIWNNNNNFKIYRLLKNDISDMLIKFDTLSKKSLASYKTFYFNFAKKLNKAEQKINKIKINKNITSKNLQILKLYKSFVLKNIKEYNITCSVAIVDQETNRKQLKTYYKNFHTELYNSFIILHKSK